MSSKKKIISLMILLVLIAFSCLLFFGIGNGDKTNIQVSSFIFVLLTEVLIVGNVLFLTEKGINNTFTIAGLSSLTFLYSVCSLLFNVVLQSIFTTLKGNLIFNFSILLIYLFIALLIFLFKKENKENE